jgi:DNA-3-methyladenine glycosylase
MASILQHAFYQQCATDVAPNLLGAVLVRDFEGQRVSGMIVETEAYTGQADAASHAYRGRTKRNQPMWEAPGHAYVYLNYGVHWMLNVVCEPVGQPAAVLIRAIEPVEGLDIIRHNRVGRRRQQWASGPGRLTLALQIDQHHNQLDLTKKTSGLWIEQGHTIPSDQIKQGPRIGLGKRVSTEWINKPWRWWIDGNPHVSR